MAWSKDEKKVVLEKGECSCEVHLYGATVTSFKVKGKEILFVSSKAKTDGSKAIRGGVPVVFPQFGKVAGSELPQHGFARNSTWSWIGVSKENDEEISAQFGLSAANIPEALGKLWPHTAIFNLVLTVSVYKSGKLDIAMQVKNIGKAGEFPITPLLHTYLRCSKSSDLSISGFSSCQYLDKLLHESVGVLTDANSTAKIASEVDRVYIRVGNDIAVKNTGVMDTVTVSKNGFSDVVLWNPWIEKSKSMADFDDEEYHQMVCVEPGTVIDPIVIKPDQSWTGTQTIAVT